MGKPTVVEWLDGLRRGGLATIDPDMVIDAERLLAAWTVDGERIEVEDAADALAARVASGAEQYRLVREDFVRTFGERGRGGVPRGGTPGVEGQLEDGSARGGMWRGWPWVGAGVLVMGGVAWWLLRPADTVSIPQPLSQPDSELTSSPARHSGSASASATLRQTKDVVETPLPWSVESLQPLVWPVVVSLVLVTLGLRLLRAGRIVRRANESATREGIEARKKAIDRDGIGRGEPYRFDVPPPLDPTAIDAAADLLGRPTDGDRGDHLDVSRTLDRTLRAGGWVRPYFLRARRQPVVLVLVDVEGEGRTSKSFPLAHAAEWILERWRRTGLHVERFDYLGIEPLRVWRPGSARRTTLE